LLSGLLWVPAGISAVIAVRCLGVGIAQGVWGGLTLLVSFGWATIVFKEELISIPLSILAIFLVALGTLGMAISRFQFWITRFPFCCEKEYESLKSGALDIQINITEKEAQQFSLDLGCCVLSQSTIGYSAAIFDGIWSGSIMVPLKLSNQSVDTGIVYVFSFGVGAAVVNVLIVLAYFAFLYIKKEQIPSFQLRVMAIPGSISGILWSTANYMAIYAVLLLGLSLETPGAHASIIVSGLWGIFYYQEIRSFQIFVWFISAGTLIVGVLLIAQMKPG